MTSFAAVADTLHLACQLTIYFQLFFFPSFSRFCVLDTGGRRHILFNVNSSLVNLAKNFERYDYTGFRHRSTKHFILCSCFHDIVCDLPVYEPSLEVWSTSDLFCLVLLFVPYGLVELGLGFPFPREVEGDNNRVGKKKLCSDHITDYDYAKVSPFRSCSCH